MKKGIHPPYQEILFIDSSNGYKFVCGSALQTDRTEMFEGKEYPAYYVSVSSASHPFFTGSKQFIDAEGRVDKFLKRYAKKQQVNQEQSKQNQEQKKEESAKSSKKKKG